MRATEEQGMQFPLPVHPQTLAEEFIAFAMKRNALRFGAFKTKAGRMSPYFFNAGEFNDGFSLGHFAKFYAKAIIQSGLQFDGMFGPAYKAIPLVATVAVSLAGFGRNYPYTYNRKEKKDHGDGGELIGAPLKGRILFLDDVISAGTSVRESVEFIRNAGAELAGGAVALDRQEKGTGESSAIQEVQKNYGVPVISIAALTDVVSYFEKVSAIGENVDEVIARINAYRQQYGAKAA
jgi:orotate phosphoribosyltransferase